MSVNLVHVGGISRPMTTSLTTTNVTDLLAGDFAVTKEQRAKLASVAIVNVDTSNACRGKLFYNDGSSDYQFWGENMAAGTTAFIDNFPVQLLDGWTLKGQAENANDLVITVILANALGQNG
jgi:hypothetical protein